MLKFVAAFLLLIATTEARKLDVSLISPARINKVADGPVSPKAMSGFTDCGVSQLVDIRVAGCTSVPCQVSAGTTFTLEAEFNPRDMHWDMEHRAILLKETQLVELSEGPLPDSTVYPGEVYAFNYEFVVPSTLSGSSEFRIKVFQNYVHEICLVIPLNIV